MKTYQCVLWDLDGTLADTSEGVINAVKYAEKSLNLPRLDETVYHRFIGPPNRESYSRYYNIDNEHLEEAIIYHKKYSVEQGYKEAQLYPGIIEVLNSIKQNGIFQAVVTLKLEETAQKVVHFFGIQDCFDVIAGVTPEIKQKKELIEKSMNLSGISAEQCVLIGDSIYDLQAARETNIDFIGVTYGFGFQNEEELQREGVKRIAQNVLDILPYIRERKSE